jgi:zinc/manganese transport system permease protein
LNWAALDPTIVGPAFIAGAIVLCTHVPLGREVLSRGIIFIDLAVAQTAGLGVIAANMVGWDVHGVPAQLAAFGAALGAAFLLTWTESRFEEIQEALIGMLFVLSATGGILLLANNPRGGEELKDLLVGQILWVDVVTLWPAAIISVLVAALWLKARQKLGRPGFYVLFALSVTISVQLVGIFLVFASLIAPAIGVRNFKRLALPVGYGVGLLGYLIGLMLSAQLDWPTGAIIVWSLVTVSILTASLAPARLRS